MADLTEQQLLSTDPEVQGLQRQRQLANLLTGQAFNQPQGQVISGRYVAPSNLQQALPMINAAIGGLTNANLDTQQQKLAEALRGKQQEVMQAWSQAKTPQEKFAIGTSQYAPKELQSATYEMLKPIHTKEGEIVSERNFGPEGGFNTILSGGMSLPAEVKSAAIRLGLDPTKSSSWGPREFSAIDQKVNADKLATRPSVSVTMDKGLAAQVGPMMKESKEKTIGAIKEIDAANQVIGALDSNKMFTGPLANTRLSVAQLGSTLGVGGKDVNDKINNTRAAIQGLAEITLQGRQEMRGQGAITESEGKLAERAKSGDISLTPGELKQLAGAAKRAGEYTYNQHQGQLQAMAQNPETRQLIPYYNVGMMPQRQMPQAQPNPNEQLGIPSTNGWSVKSVR